MPFSSADVIATILSIKDSSIKSPYFEAWKDIEVETPDEKTAIFHLANPYGPFIFNTLVGIIPAHLDSGSISASPIGTGPYKFTKVSSGKNNSINEVVIERSESYFGQKPYIKTVKFKIAKDENEAKSLFRSGSVDALSGLSVEGDDNVNYLYPTSRQFGLVFNLKNEKFADIANRNKIKNKEKSDPKFTFSLLVLDKPLSVSAAESLVKEYKDLGIEIGINKKSAIEYQDLLQKRTFEAVLYGFDTGYDRDPYPFWHSSQIEKGNNFAGLSNKNADILLEDARMATDSTLRNQKYDQFFAILNEQSVVIFLPAENFKVTIRHKVQNISTIKGYEPWDHLNGFSDWYLKTKRVKP
jgi:ABC-type transport system substrate-binding protein